MEQSLTYPEPMPPQWPATNQTSSWRSSASADVERSDRVIPDDQLPAASYRRGGLAPWQIKRLLAHIGANLEQKMCIADLAAVTHLSVSHFAHAFRMSFDASPAALIRRRRLDRARQMLLTSDLPLAEIALACGFADQAHMSRLFRRHMDLPPGKWRDRMLVETAFAPRSTAMPTARQ